MVQFTPEHAKAGLIPSSRSLSEAAEGSAEALIQWVASVNLPDSLSSQAVETREEAVQTFFAFGSPHVVSHAAKLVEWLESVLANSNNNLKLPAESEAFPATFKKLPDSIVERVLTLAGGIPRFYAGVKRQMEVLKPLLQDMMFDNTHNRQLETFRATQRAAARAVALARYQKLSVTPATETLQDSDLFDNIFGGSDNVNLDTFMGELSNFAIGQGRLGFLHSGGDRGHTLALVLQKAELDYKCPPFVDKLSALVAIYTRYMLRSKEAYLSAGIEWPGVPAEATDLLSVCSDMCTSGLEGTSVSLCSALQVWRSGHDSSDDVALAIYMSLRFTGISAHHIANEVIFPLLKRDVTEKVEVDAIVALIGERAPMVFVPLREVSLATAQASDTAGSGGFASTDVGPVDLSQEKIRGFKRTEISSATQSRWLGLEMIDKDGNHCTVTGIGAPESVFDLELWFTASLLHSPNVPVRMTRDQVFKAHLNWASRQSEATPDPVLALQAALGMVPPITSVSGTHNSAEVIGQGAWGTSKNISALGHLLGTQVPGAGGSSFVVSDAQRDRVVAHAVATPTNNRDSAANALTLEFLEKVQGTITNRTGKICSKEHTSRPAASTQLETMVKIVLAKQYNGNDEYWWGAREVIQIMRAHFGRLQVPGKAKGKDPYLDLRYLQFKEEGHAQPQEFANDRASVIRFGEALEMAKELDITACPKRLEGWDHLIAIVQRKVKGSQRRCEPQDIYNYVSLSMGLLGIEFSQCVTVNLHPGELPSFHSLRDFHDLLPPALEKLNHGRRDRDRVAAEVGAELARIGMSVGSADGSKKKKREVSFGPDEVQPKHGSPGAREAALIDKHTKQLAKVEKQLAEEKRKVAAGGKGGGGKGAGGKGGGGKGGGGKGGASTKPCSICGKLDHGAVAGKATWQEWNLVLKAARNQCKLAWETKPEAIDAVHQQRCYDFARGGKNGCSQGTACIKGSHLPAG